MKAPTAKGKITQLDRSRSSHRATGPTRSYLKTRVRASRLLNAARILAIVELTRRLHQAYQHAYDKQAAEWLLPQNTSAKTQEPGQLGVLTEGAFFDVGKFRRCLKSMGIKLGVISTHRSGGIFVGTRIDTGEQIRIETNTTAYSSRELGWQYYLQVFGTAPPPNFRADGYQTLNPRYNLVANDITNIENLRAAQIHEDGNGIARIIGKSFSATDEFGDSDSGAALEECTYSGKVRGDGSLRRTRH